VLQCLDAAVIEVTKEKCNAPDQGNLHSTVAPPVFAERV
jgi:hypothetical protein